MHEFDSQDLRYLKTITGKKEHEDIDPEVADAYWAYKKCWDRTTSSPIPVEQLVTIVLIAKRMNVGQNEIEIKTIPQLVEEGRFKPGQRVEAQWRRKMVQGAFIRIGKEGRVVVALDGQDEEREFEPDLVRPLGVVEVRNVEPVESLA